MHAIGACLVPSVIRRQIESTLYISKPALFTKVLPLSDKSRLITAKIERLFSDRRIVENLKIAGLGHSDRQWAIRKLQILQRSIYALDCYGESTWEIQDRVLEEIWDNIYEALRLFGCDCQEARKLVSDIEAYQQIEIQLREGKLPTDLPIQTFYHLKTCDVRLSRTLIAKLSRYSYTPEISAAWDCYDLVGEICDDLTDIREDTFDFNCNRFLIQKEMLGDLKTYIEYAELLHIIKIRAYELMKKAEESELLEVKQICQWALQKVLEAKIILNRLIGSQQTGRETPKVMNAHQLLQFTEACMA